MGVGIAVVAHGQDETPAPADPHDDAPANPLPVEPPAPAASRPAAPPPSSHITVEGAIGPVVATNPDGSRITNKFTPGVFIRWDRYTLTNAGGFVSRREDDEAQRGLAAELARHDNWRANLGLRLDRGRDITDAETLAGLQSVRATIRARLTVTRDLSDSLNIGTSASADVLRHGGGLLVDVSINKTIPISPTAWWRIGGAVTAANQRYMQSYFGITPQPSSPPGTAVYTPGGGLRDVSTGVSLRGELGERWVGFVGAGYTILLGPARGSPLSRPTGWGVNGGIAWRFWW